MISYVGKEHHNWRRGSPEKTKRNAEIVELYLSGKSYRHIAMTYEIDHSRVVQIVKRSGATAKSEFFATARGRT